MSLVVVSDARVTQKNSAHSLQQLRFDNSSNDLALEQGRQEWLRTRKLPYVHPEKKARGGSH